MIKQGYGKILNIASLKGQEGSEGQINYCASKAGLIGLTKKRKFIGKIVHFPPRNTKKACT